MSSEERRPGDLGDNLREGVRTVAGILGALKDAVEETFDDLRTHGDLSPEKAREAARATMQRAQEELETMRGRFDFVSRREFDELRAEVATLRARLDTHSHGQGGAGPSDGGSGATGGPGGFPVDGG